MSSTPDAAALQSIGNLMRAVDAYAYDYAWKGKFAPSRTRVEELLGQAISDAKAAQAQPQALAPAAMSAEIEMACLSAWNSTQSGPVDTVHPMFLAAFRLGYKASERAQGITAAEQDKADQAPAADGSDRSHQEGERA